MAVPDSILFLLACDLIANHIAIRVYKQVPRNTEFLFGLSGAANTNRGIKERRSDSEVSRTVQRAAAQSNQRFYERRDDAFWDLFHKMDQAFDYPFDRTYWRVAKCLCRTKR
jgi:hypothetical protein